MILTSLVLALGAAVGGSSPDRREPLSLEAALTRAQAWNSDLRALREHAHASSLGAETIRKQKFPRVGLEMSAVRTNNAAEVFAHRLNAGQFSGEDLDLARLNSPGALSHLGSSLFVEVPIDLFGRINLASDSQAASQKAFAENVREAEAAVALQVTEAYLGAVLARRSELAVERAVAAARSREAITEARFNQGVALQSDVLRVRARRRAREADLASQQAEVEVAEMMLVRLLDAPEGTRYDLLDSPKPGAAGASVETWTRAAAARPVLLAAQWQRAAAASSARFEKRGSRPELAAEARFMDDRTPKGGAQSWAVGAALRWNFFDPARGKRVAAAMADERAMVDGERAAQGRVRFEVEAAFSRLTAARDRLGAAEGGAAEGREALRVIQERRAQGLATLTDELETEAAAYAAELEEINAARSVVLAEAALRRAAGANPGSPMK